MVVTRKQPRTVLEHCTAALGIHKGAFAAAHLAQYAIATVELGHAPTNDEYIEYWAISERSGWNHRAEFKQVFGDQWPAVVDAMVEQVRARTRKASVGELRRAEISIA